VNYNGISVVANASADPSNVVNLKTNNASDVLTLANSVQQYSTDYTKPTNATIRVSGPGRVVLQSGGSYSQQTYGGDWELNSGILQIGPVEPNPMRCHRQDMRDLMANRSTHWVSRCLQLLRTHLQAVHMQMPICRMR